MSFLPPANNRRKRAPSSGSTAPRREATQSYPGLLHRPGFSSVVRILSSTCHVRSGLPLFPLPRARHRRHTALRGDKRHRQALLRPAIVESPLPQFHHRGERALVRFSSLQPLKWIPLEPRIVLDRIPRNPMPLARWRNSVPCHFPRDLV
jgi:hypothetical protein